MISTGFIFSLINDPMTIYWEWKNRKTIYLIEEKLLRWRPVALHEHAPNSFSEKYAAINGKRGELSKILIEHTSSVYVKKIFAQGEVWELGEGYNLTLISLEVIDDPRKALLSLSHNNVILKESWVPSGGIFSYSENVSSGQINAPKFVTYLDAIFVGCCFDFAQLRYTFLTSDNIRGKVDELNWCHWIK